MIRITFWGLLELLEHKPFTVTWFATLRSVKNGDCSTFVAMASNPQYTVYACGIAKSSKLELKMMLVPMPLHRTYLIRWPSNQYPQ